MLKIPNNGDTRHLFNEVVLLDEYDIKNTNKY